MATDHYPDGAIAPSGFRGEFDVAGPPRRGPVASTPRRAGPVAKLEGASDRFFQTDRLTARPQCLVGLSAKTGLDEGRIRLVPSQNYDREVSRKGGRIVRSR